MTRARKDLINLATTPYYHCICRCVWRAFLCGEDHLTGKNYEHRKDWVVERLTELAGVFAIDICAYAVSAFQPLPCGLKSRSGQGKCLK